MCSQTPVNQPYRDDAVCHCCGQTLTDSGRLRVLPLTGTSDCGESENTAANMLLSGLTSEVDTPDWVDKGVHGRTWCFSHAMHIQRANSRAVYR